MMGACPEMVVGSPGSRAEALVRLRTPPRWPVRWWSALVVALALGAALLGWGVASLREAHLYRQSSGEGLKFAWVSVALFWAHLLLGAAGWAIVRLRAAVSSDRARRAVLWLGVAIIVGLVVADALAIWVEWHGDRCIGPCGDGVGPST